MDKGRLRRVVDVHAHLWETTIGGHTYFNQDALDGWVSKFGLGGSVPIDVDGARLVNALDRAEEELGIDEYQICAFAIDLRPRFQMDIPLPQLNDWVISQAQSDERGRILPFACMNPLVPEAVNEVWRTARPRYPRLQALPADRFLSDDPTALPFYEAVLAAQQDVGRPLPVPCTGASPTPAPSTRSLFTSRRWPHGSSLTSA